MKILVAGDFVPGKQILQNIESKNFSFFSQVKNIISQVDYSIINFESPIIIKKLNPIKKTGPNLSCPISSMEALKWAGFNCVTLANNHFRDYGQKGVEDTIKICKRYNIDYVGGGSTQEEAGKILYKVIQNKKIAIVNFCEHEWSIATEDYGGSNPINIIQNYYDIQRARKNAEIVIAIIHGGIEHYNLPTIRMKELYRFYINIGADIVINHHQHCFSGYEIYRGKPIFYGLGNFCFEKLNDKLPTSCEYGYSVILDNNDKNEFEFELKPYKQCGKNYMGVDFEVDIQLFNKQMEKLNAIIQNDAILNKCYYNLVEKTKSQYLSYLMPYNNKYILAMARRRLIPRFISKTKAQSFYAVVNCESHRERLISSLKDIIK